MPPLGIAQYELRALSAGEAESENTHLSRLQLFDGSGAGGKFGRIL